MTIELGQAKQRFRRFSRDAATASPLYARLSSHVSQDDEVASLLTVGSDESAAAPLLFAAAHYLLDIERVGELARYYPTLGGSDPFSPDTWVQFRQFVLDRWQSMQSLVESRVVQTNEPGRAAFLYPAVSVACDDAQEPVALVDVGCSAGLLLAFDGYTVDYMLEGASHRIAGPADGGVRLQCMVDGSHLADVGFSVRIAERVGIEKNPVDLADPESRRWLRACVWADQAERLHNLERALEVTTRIERQIVIGDVASQLESALGMVPLTRPVVVITSWSLPYMARLERASLVARLASVATRRRLWWIDIGPYEDGPSLVHGESSQLAFATSGLATLTLTIWAHEVPYLRVLGQVDPFGQRLWGMRQFGVDPPEVACAP
jgi:hypothetical protein